jgi:hypothetical protein
MDCQYGLVEGNVITMHSCGPDYDNARDIMDGIRINDYFAGYTGNSIVKDNTIYIYGNRASKYTPAAQRMVGITSVTGGGPMTYENNKVICRSIDAEVVVIAIMPRSQTGLGKVTWQDNYYESDHVVLHWYLYAQQDQNSEHINCTFVKPLSAIAGFQTLSTEEAVFSSDDRVKGVQFTNCILIGGATFRDPNMGSSAQAWDYVVNYTLTAKVAKVNKTELLSGVTVTIRDNTGTIIDTGVTDENGEFTVGKQIDFYCENVEGNESSSSISTSSSSVSTSSSSVSVSSISTSSVSSSSISTSSSSSDSSESSSSSVAVTENYRYIEYNPYKIEYLGRTLLYTLDSTEYAWCYYNEESNVYTVS